MKWVRFEKDQKIPIKSWCAEIEKEAMTQALNLSKHPLTVSHVALMPDCHVGYGMPIGGVIACQGGIIPNAVGVDIGCGMIAVETDFDVLSLPKDRIRKILDDVKSYVPLGEGNSHQKPQKWDGFEKYFDMLKNHQPSWMGDGHVWELARKNLGTLGGGNHFIDMQKSSTGRLWIMIHSGSRNLGYRIASHYHERAARFVREHRIPMPDMELAYFPEDNFNYHEYARDMSFAMKYAMENRNRIIGIFKGVVSDNLSGISFRRQINIHHNYASLEDVGKKKLWVHRKGAISAEKGTIGIIPGSMGTPSYIVKGLGNPESFCSSSHGAGRILSRTKACESLSVEACDRSMGDVVFDRWKKARSKFRKNREKSLFDLSESPLAYKNIDEVIESQKDLVEPIERLIPLGVIKG